jgi:diaminohydroxyphosphoribosylaminopyrimidine deaminase/5-amino-6-(5-phosphoribosylamino)uracil reductase
MTEDEKFMRRALAAARRAWGGTGSNPAVGCVLVHNGQVLAVAATAAGGRPHAEARALTDAGERARGSTAYVTLEPCAHHGETPPCAEALIRAGIARAVVACRDADPRTHGAGISLLREAGIPVREGVLAAEARTVYAGFFSRVRGGMPEINLKIATSADGKIAYPPGDAQRWITGEAARNFGHLLRAEHDAILTGIGTVLADDPLLTCRLPGMDSRSPLRVVMDSRARLPEDSALARSAARHPLLVLTAAPPRRKIPHVEWCTLPEMTLAAAARALAGRGVNRVLVEAGRTLSSHAMESGLVSALYWFRAPEVIGAGGLDAFSSPLPPLFLRAAHALGTDRLDVYDCKRCA